MKNHETKTGRKRSPCAPHTQGAWAHLWSRHPGVRAHRNSFPSRFPPVISFRCIIFAYITPRSPRGLYIVFSSCFELFLSGVDLKLGGASWPLQATTRAKGPGKLITKAKSGRRSRVLVEQGQETLLLKDQRKLDVSFLMICRGQHYTFWI
jgi:hypothetical protein